MGGGACWNEETCGMQKDYLTFPNNFDSFVGMSCSEIRVEANCQCCVPRRLEKQILGNTTQL